jgi:hypothetical protein
VASTDAFGQPSGQLAAQIVADEEAGSAVANAKSIILLSLSVKSRARSSVDQSS